MKRFLFKKKFLEIHLILKKIIKSETRVLSKKIYYRNKKNKKQKKIQTIQRTFFI